MTRFLMIKRALFLIIQVIDEELQGWCNPWQLTLVVNVLGKQLNYRIQENKMNRDCAIRRNVKIIDLPRGYYMLFTSSLRRIIIMLSFEVIRWWLTISPCPTVKTKLS